MSFEIERKFLLKDDGWRSSVTATQHLRDGLIGRAPGGNKIRVRLDQERAWITVKGPRVGLRRAEYEYEIPREHAEEMLGTMCRNDVLAKTRHHVRHQGHTWTIDVYEELLDGIALAEVELGTEGESIALPSWVGAEISDDPRFRKIAMLGMRRRTGGPITVEDILASPGRALPARLKALWRSLSSGLFRSRPSQTQ